MKMVEKASKAERYNHWVLMLSFIVLFITGLGFMYNSLHWLNTIFGGAHLARDIHNWAGLVFGISLLFTIGNYLGESLRFTSDDTKWLGMKGGYFSKESPPPQGRLNAGQKLFYLCVLVFGLLISISGLIIWLAADNRPWVSASLVIHTLAFLVFAVAVPLHGYLATAANPGTFRVMTHGKVPLEWAKKKHAKWIEEAGLE
jgi:formate dehydrogenase subunit gamma